MYSNNNNSRQGSSRPQAGHQQQQPHLPLQPGGTTNSSSSPMMGTPAAGSGLSLIPPPSPMMLGGAAGMGQPPLVVPGGGVATPNSSSLLAPSPQIQPQLLPPQQPQPPVPPAFPQQPQLPQMPVLAPSTSSMTGLSAAPPPPTYLATANSGSLLVGSPSNGMSQARFNGASQDRHRSMELSGGPQFGSPRGGSSNMLAPPTAGAVGGASGGARPQAAARREVPRIIPCAPRHPPNMALIAGYPWSYTEQQVAEDLSAFHIPTCVRAYEDPSNGMSRGTFFVEFSSPTQLVELKQNVKQCGPYALRVELCHLTSPHWDRQGKLPEPPADMSIGGSPFSSASVKHVSSFAGSSSSDILDVGCSNSIDGGAYNGWGFNNGVRLNANMPSASVISRPATNAPIPTAAQQMMQEGFGPQGFATRAISLGLANTVSDEGVNEVERFRKRLRDGQVKA